MNWRLETAEAKMGVATGQPQGVGSEAYLNGTSQGAPVRHPRTHGRAPISVVAASAIHEIYGLKEHPHGKLPFTLYFTLIRIRIVAPLQP